MLENLVNVSRQDLLDMEAANTMVVTVNNRMAIQLKKALIEVNRSHAKVFELPQVQPWPHFLDFLTERVVFATGEVPAAKQLSHFAALLYWEKVLEEQQLSTLNLTKLARVLADAHSLQEEWAIAVDGAEETPEYSEYKHIKRLYLQRLVQREVIDGTLRDQWLLDRLQQSIPLKSSAAFAKNIVLLGFRELSPIQSALLSACQDLGATLYSLEVEPGIAANLEVFSAHSRREELEAAVDWAKAKLTAQPQGRFAIIDPMLQTETNTVRRYLHERIQEAGLKTDLLYNVAIGRALSDWPIVRSSLAWLGLFITLEQHNRIATQDLGESLLLAQETLLSAWADSFNALDLKLREANKISYRKTTVQQFFNDISDEFSNLIKTAFEIFCDSKSLRLNQWLQKFKTFFELFKFPGLKKLSSVQYQVCNAFDQALKNASALSPVLDPMSATEAFHLLDRLCRQQIFQPQRAATARLDVLGILEAEGAQWDAVWILSMQDDVLPTVPKPNPLIPKVALQRAGAPRSDHQREFLWAEAMLKSLLETASEVTISWHAFSGEMPTKASPLIAQYLPEDQWSSLDMLAAATPAESAAFETVTVAEIESLSDDFGPAVDGLLSGGTRLIDLQAINPQWAFAVYRLHMREFHSYPRYELDRMQRGSFIHAALERFWQDVREQSILKAMDEAELRAKITEVVNACARSELLFDSQALLALEKEYAKNQLFHFLTLEQQRELSFSVEEVEKNVEITLSRIRLRVKVDRIDYLENNSFLYLDYKTGNLPNYKKNWYRERPIDLQLPLYAAYGNHTVSDIGGVGFAGLKPGKMMGFAGVGLVNWSTQGRSSGVEEKQAHEFQSLLSEWRGKLTTLADEIANGYAANRYEDKKDMSYCEVLPFLRLEQVVEEEEWEDE
ncbi:MAG: PD-(D/E)XK nuclease family protein [Alcaligenaceae bacterium]|nr:PD-(D/E)XK nuclease family protein [Alcaligenaceae bacterium]